MLSDLDHFDAFHLGSNMASKGLFGDSVVSFWVSQSIWIPLLNFGLIFVPLPSILLSASPSVDPTEDTMFILSIISALSIIGSNIWSIRFLGLLGLVMGTQKCNEIGNKQRLSNRTI